MPQGDDSVPRKVGDEDREAAVSRTRLLKVLLAAVGLTLVARSPDGRYLAAYLQVNLLTQDGVTVVIELEDDWERPGPGR